MKGKSDSEQPLESGSVVTSTPSKGEIPAAGGGSGKYSKATCSLQKELTSHHVTLIQEGIASASWPPDTRVDMSN